MVVGREIYKLKDIMRYCKTKIKRQPIPSVDDITEIKAEKILEKASSYIDHGNLPEMMDILEEHLDDKEYSALEMAAAFLMMELGRSRIRSLDRMILVIPEQNQAWFVCLSISERSKEYASVIF